MKKVKDTKAPTVRQLCNMATTLKEHFGCYASVKVEANHYEHSNKLVMEYAIYTLHKGVYTVLTWQELLAYYHGLMKSKGRS